jgi:hypothetical protein
MILSTATKTFLLRKKWILLVLPVFLLGLWLLVQWAKPTVEQVWQGRGIDATLLTDSGGLKSNELYALSQGILQGNLATLENTLASNPRLLNKVQQALAQLAVRDDDWDNDYIVAVFDFIFSVRAISSQENTAPNNVQAPEGVQDFLQQAFSSSSDLNSVLSRVVRSLSDGSVWNLSEEKLVGSASRLMASYDSSLINIPTMGRSSSSDDILLHFYHLAISQRSQHRIAEHGVLQAIWLREVRADGFSSMGFIPRMNEAFTQVKT